MLLHLKRHILSTFSQSGNFGNVLFALINSVFQKETDSFATLKMMIGPGSKILSCMHIDLLSCYDWTSYSANSLCLVFA